MKVLVYREDLFRPSETFVWQRDVYPTDTNVQFASLKNMSGEHSGGGRSVIEAAPWDFGYARAGKALFRTLGFSSKEFRRLLDWADIVHAHFAVDAASLLPAIYQSSARL